MITMLLSTAQAYDGVPQWDDPIVDRAPREQTVSVAQGLVIGDSGLANTRLQLGLTPYSRDRFGFGLTGAGQLNVTWVPAEERTAVGIGGSEVALHLWFAPKRLTRTSHDVYVGFSARGPARSYLVRVDDVFIGPRVGYAGYYQVSDAFDVSADAHVGGGGPPAGIIGLFGAANLTLYGSPNKEDWVALAGVDASVTTVAGTVGVRKRFGGALEGGVALVVPLYTALGGAGEVPLWPVLDLRGRL